MQGINSRKVFTFQHIKKCHVARVGREEVQYSLRDVKKIPSLNGPNQKLNWSTLKQEYQHLKNLDLCDTDTGPVQLIIGTNNSDLILPKRTVKPSGQPEVDRVPYAVETLLGWAATNWLPGERRVASAYNGFKVCNKLELGMVFRNTRVDVFGPMLVEERRSEIKVYGCLFTCMSARRLLNFVYQRKRKCRTVNCLDERCVSTRGGVVPPACSTFISSRVAMLRMTGQLVARGRVRMCEMR